MSKLILVGLSVALLSLTACGGRYHMTDMGAVSMTHRAIEPGTQTTNLGEVEAQFCAGDDTPLVGDGDNVGLMDEAIMAAQKKSGADYLTAVQFFKENNCVIVKGEGHKISEAATPAAPTPPTEAPKVEETTTEAAPEATPGS